MSGRKNVLTSYKMVDSVDMGGDITSDPTNVQFLDNLSICLSFPGASGPGQFFIEVSNDNVNWQALDITPAMLASDPDQRILIEITQLSASLIRVRFVSNGSSGFLTAVIEGKAI